MHVKQTFREITDRLGAITVSKISDASPKTAGPATGKKSRAVTSRGLIVDEAPAGVEVLDIETALCHEGFFLALVLTTNKGSEGHETATRIHAQLERLVKLYKKDRSAHRSQAACYAPFANSTGYYHEQFFIELYLKLLSLYFLESTLLDLTDFSSVFGLKQRITESLDHEYEFRSRSLKHLPELAPLLKGLNHGFSHKTKDQIGYIL